MRNREEMRQNDPGKRASCNVGAICSKIPVIKKHAQHGTQRKANVNMGTELLLPTCDLENT